MKHLLSIADLKSDDIADLLALADSFVEVNSRPIPKVPALTGKTVVSLFFEDSTRTRLSFETAARRLSADVMTFSVATSSVKKGESLRDTIETIEAMGMHAVVVRHSCAGTPSAISRWTNASVINAGDGRHQHPTQALLDSFTITRTLGRTSLDGLHIGILGDIAHSRVARSNVLAFTALGARVTLIAPPTLLPVSLEGWPVDVSHSLDDVIGSLDVAYVLRMQLERQESGLVPSLREYTSTYGLTRARAARLPGHALVLHPGPMNRGIEIDHEVTELPGSLITRQVTNGVAVRMAVLFRLLGSGGVPS
jgi:aspartate carbamoyltransferase catalytic subunit